MPKGYPANWYVCPYCTHEPYDRARLLEHVADRHPEATRSDTARRCAANRRSFRLDPELLREQELTILWNSVRSEVARRSEVAPTTWDPWWELRNRPHIDLVWACVHPSKGRIMDTGDARRRLVLDPCLNHVERRETLTHELIHDELGLLWVPGTAPEIVAAGERIVREATAARLCGSDGWSGQAERSARRSGGMSPPHRP